MCRSFLRVQALSSKIEQAVTFSYLFAVNLVRARGLSLVSVVVSVVVSSICYAVEVNQKGGVSKMKKLSGLWRQYGTPRNLKVAYIVLTLIALAVASGAPGAGSGAPGGVGLETIIRW